MQLLGQSNSLLKLKLLVDFQSLRGFLVMHENTLSSMHIMEPQIALPGKCCNRAHLKLALINFTRNDNRRYILLYQMVIHFGKRATPVL